MEISVRKANINDLDDIMFLQENNEILLTRQALDDDLLNVDKLCLVAQNYNLIIGYIICDVNVEHADITALLVDKTFRNLTVGSTLMNHLIFYLTKDDIENIFLEVRSSNTKAISFYTKQGFKYISKRANYYPGDDAFVYKKVITN